MLLNHLTDKCKLEREDNLLLDTTIMVAITPGPGGFPHIPSADAPARVCQTALSLDPHRRSEGGWRLGPFFWCFALREPVSARSPWHDQGLRHVLSGARTERKSI